MYRCILNICSIAGAETDMKWNIVADTSIDLFELEQSYENISFSTVPFTLTVGDKNFVDDDNRLEFVFESFSQDVFRLRHRTFKRINEQ